MLKKNELVRITSYDPTNGDIIFYSGDGVPLGDQVYFGINIAGELGSPMHYRIENCGDWRILGYHRSRKNNDEVMLSNCVESRVGLEHRHPFYSYHKTGNTTAPKNEYKLTAQVINGWDNNGNPKHGTTREKALIFKDAVVNIRQVRLTSSADGKVSLSFAVHGDKKSQVNKVDDVSVVTP